MASPDDSALIARRRLGRSAAVLLVAFAGLCLAWGIDSAMRANTVARNVHVLGVDLSGMTSNEIREATAPITSGLRDEPVTISVADRTVTTDLLNLGVRVDHDRLISDAFAARTDGSVLSGPFRWASSFRAPVELDLPYLIEADTLQAAVDGFISPQLSGPEDPTVELGNNAFLTRPGTAGSVIDPAELLERVNGLVGQTGPHAFSLTAFPQKPGLSVDSVGRTAIELNLATEAPLVVRVLDQTTELSPSDLRSIVDLENTPEGTFWQVNQERALDLIRPRFDRLGDETSQARFIVVQDRPEIVPADQTLVCCDDKTSALLRAALLSQPTVPLDEDGQPTDTIAVRTVELLPIVTDGTKGVAELESLGITELVSTFTTNHPCCENRVTNIQLFADAVRGTIIEPGEVLSFNELVGQRTPEKGYLEAGAINLGSLEPQYGGGVSQAVTTIFNAAFFAGLDFEEYQAHSLYFSRYPVGREATISWPRPDLKVRNSSDYGVLIWTEYTGTSITVSMFSTKHIEVEALPIVRRSQNQCRRVTTPRERIYPDGKVVVDEVFAVYRPAQGLNCNGDPSDPNAVVPTTTTAPPATTTAPPTQPATTTPAPTTPPVTEPSSTTTEVTEPPTSPTTASTAPPTSPTTAAEALTPAPDPSTEPPPTSIEEASAADG